MWWFGKKPALYPPPQPTVEVGMRQRDVRRLLGEPMTKSSTDEWLRQHTGPVMVFDRKPRNEETWLYDHFPHHGDSTMLKFWKGRVTSISTIKK